MKSLLALLLPAVLAAQGTLLQIRVLEGEGAVHPPGSRGPGPVVEVTDAIGRPIAGGVVSFRLPDEGPGGAFANGLSSEIVTTGADGRAATSPIRWNRLAGALEIRVTVVKDRFRAGTVIAQYLSDTMPGRRTLSAGPVVVTPAPRIAKAGRRTRWIWIVLAGAAGAGFAAGWAASRGGEPARTGVDIGTPTVTIGTP